MCTRKHNTTQKAKGAGAGKGAGRGIVSHGESRRRVSSAELMAHNQNTPENSRGRTGKTQTPPKFNPHSGNWGLVTQYQHDTSTNDDINENGSHSLNSGGGGREGRGVSGEVERELKMLLKIKEALESPSATHTSQWLQRLRKLGLTHSSLLERIHLCLHQQQQEQQEQQQQGQTQKQKNLESFSSLC